MTTLSLIITPNSIFDLKLIEKIFLDNLQNSQHYFQSPPLTFFICLMCFLSHSQIALNFFVFFFVSAFFLPT